MKIFLHLIIYFLGISLAYAALTPVSQERIRGKYGVDNINRPIIDQGLATTFAHGSRQDGCKADRMDQQNNQRSASGQILSKKGVKAIPAVAVRKGKMYSVVEVRAGDKCKAFPLLDRGPGNPKAKIDLTGSAYDILMGVQPCTSVAGLGTLTKSIPKVEFAVDPNINRKIPPGGHQECVLLASPKNAPINNLNTVTNQLK